MKCSCFEYGGTNSRSSRPGRLATSLQYAWYLSWQNGFHSTGATEHFGQRHVLTLKMPIFIEIIINGTLKNSTVYSVPRFQCLYLFLFLFFLVGSHSFIVHRWAHLQLYALWIYTKFMNIVLVCRIQYKVGECDSPGCSS